MADIIQFVPKSHLDSAKNLLEFIRMCREDLTVFGVDLKWEENHWHIGVAFGNIDQKTRILDPTKVMAQPFLDFAKAYFRYQQGHKPTKSYPEMRALKCIERVLFKSNNNPQLANMNTLVLDQAAILAKKNFSGGMAYHVGREIARIAKFVSDKHLIPGKLDWKSPVKRPIDTVRTGQKAKENREKKLPNEDLMHALADIFASRPTDARDIFTSSVAAMLLCAPSRISEVLTLPVDCEVWQTKRDGIKAYGWRFQPGKGGSPFIKWIPDVMVGLAQEAIARIREVTEEARNIARWYEKNPTSFYRHADCPNVPEDKPLTVVESAWALGIPIEDLHHTRCELRRFGVSGREGSNTLATLHQWAMEKLPEDYPWFDKEKGIRYSNALFCFQDRQLRSGTQTSPIMVWQPTTNIFNNDLTSRETNPGYIVPSIFDRHGFNENRIEPLKANSHQFRHLLNTMAQRGGLGQSEVARWSGRADMKQNRIYDHMSEFELVAMLRSHDSSLSLDRPLEEIAEQVAAKLPMTRQEFNMLAIPTAHLTEYGFCIHDFTMAPCQRFRDCLNCTEQVCIKGDRRVENIKERHQIVVRLKEEAAKEIEEGTAGADRWYEIHDLTDKRLQQLVGIMEDPNIQDGAIIKLKNDNEFSPLRRAVESRLNKTNKQSDKDRPLLEDMRNLLGGGLG